MTTAVREAARALIRCERPLLVGHVNPDGDTLGCALALHEVAVRLGKQPVTAFADPVPAIYQWLPGASTVVRSVESGVHDVAFVCDSGALERVGSSLEPAVRAAPLLVCIDHHVADTMFGDIQVLDSAAAATAELVWDVIAECALESGTALTSRTVADNLMAAIITDTGSFRFPNVRPRTFEIAAELRRLGAEPAKINEAVFETRSEAAVRLLGIALKSMEVSETGSVAWAYLSAADFTESGGTDEDTEGIVNHVLAVRSVHTAVLFREIPGRKVRVSMRARAGGDVASIAAMFGGGGHRLAAGCSVDAPLSNAMKQVLPAVLAGAVPGN